MLQLHTMSLPRWRARTRLALAGVAACVLVVLGATPLLAGGESGGNGGGPMAPSAGGSGGGSVGSLPLTAPPPPDHTANPFGGPTGTQAPSAASDPLRPVFSLVGRESEIRAVIVAAYGNGYVERIPLGSGDRVRMDFHGAVTVELARGRFQTSFVSAQIVVGSTYQGGRAVLYVDGEPRGAYPLIAGVIDLALHRLSQSGVTDLGVLWRAANRTGDRTAIEIDSSAAVIRVRQR
jgi:hypothetical protein